jgi:hypothetical protein
MMCGVEAEGMSRTFQDRNFLIWEVYPSGGKHGYSENPHLIFHCLTDRDLRPRYAQLGEDEAAAERRVRLASHDELLDLLDNAREID